MNQHSSRPTTALRTAAVALVLSGTAVGLGATPASARLVPGEPAARVQIQVRAGGPVLERVGDQLVRGDALTGNGVPAPGYVPEQ